ELQPCRKEGRTPIGDPVSNFYHTIIDEKTFYLAQASQKNRKTYKGGGQRGLLFTNLFTGMCKCLDCGGSYRFLVRGSYAKLICDNHYMGAGCSNSRKWRYDDVESAALLILSEQVDWFSALGGNSSGREKLESELRSLNGKLADLNKRVDRYRQLFEASEGEHFNDAMNSYLKAMRASEVVRDSIKVKESELKAFTPAQASVEMLNKAFYELVNDDNPVRIFELRAQINSIFKRAGVILYFNGGGTFYYIRSTKQKGVLLSSEHSEVEGIAAELLRVKMIIPEMANVAAKALAIPSMIMEHQP
ncbi:MAG: zinc ribbon domain-containing protein, partial [Ghiorsea sp.]|nr:zinc ribbon domain-containing protein [Ghiorsea sp.]